jgi:hypothetical protein
MLAFRPDSGVGESAPAPATRTVASAPTAATTSKPSAPVSGGAFDGDWAKLCRQLDVSGAAKELARNAELIRFEDGCFELVVPKAMPHLTESTYREKLRSALQQRLGQAVRVRAVDWRSTRIIPRRARRQRTRCETRRGDTFGAGR